MTEFLYAQALEFWGWLSANFDPIWDTADILVVALGIYFLLLLIKGTRAVQILFGVMFLIALKLASDFLQLATVGFILDNFSYSAVLIIIVLFQADIRRGLARMGRGFWPTFGGRLESVNIEEVVRAAQTLAAKRVGALIVLERETNLDDMIEAGTEIHAELSKELLTSLFLPYSPLHDGAVVIQEGRLAYAGCILPLTLKLDLPEGVGTRHRAAIGITEETDAVVIVVSEETASISVVVNGEMVQDLDAPRLREVLRDLLAGGRRDLSEEAGDEGQSAAPAPPANADAEPAR